MNRQAICDALNSMEVVEKDGGDYAYILVENSEKNRNKLTSLGVSDERIDAVKSDDNTFCILALAFYDGTPLADDYVNGKFIIWNPLIDDELRYRVLNGDGTATDAERLLRALEPEFFVPTESTQADKEV